MAGRQDQAAYLSYDYFDAHLTEHGWRQAHALRDHIAALPEPLRVDAVIVSPLSRALETAAGAFGGGAWRADDGPPLMAALESEPVRQGPRHSFMLPTVRALQGVSEHSERPAPGTAWWCAAFRLNKRVSSSIFSIFAAAPYKMHLTFSGTSYSCLILRCPLLLARLPAVSAGIHHRSRHSGLWALPCG